MPLGSGGGSGEEEESGAVAGVGELEGEAGGGRGGDDRRSFDSERGGDRPCSKWIVSAAFEGSRLKAASSSLERSLRSW